MNLYESIKSSSHLSYDELQEIVNEVIQSYKDHNCEFYYEYYILPEKQQIVVEVYWGDWKHDHGTLDWAFKEAFNKRGIKYTVDETVTEEDGSDTYSATHVYKIF